MKNVLLILFLFLGALLPAQVEKSLIASFSFSGNAKDSISKIEGRVVGASLSSDRFGNANAAYCFDGENDFISLGTNRDLRQHIMSISLWVKLNGTNHKARNFPGMPFISTRAIHEVEYYEAYLVSLDSRSRRFGACTTSPIQQQSSTISNIKVEIDKWYHIVYMFDLDTSYLYVNGELNQKNIKGFVSNYMVSDSVMLGYDGNRMPDDFKYQNYAFLNGCLDDIKFYSRVLSREEVKSLYNAPNTRFPQVASSDINVMDLIKRFWYIPVLLALLVFLVIVLVRWRVNYFRRKEKERNELQQKFAQMEMKALRSQMNPHFIFNAINSIQHYVLTNEKELANKYLVKFSQLMRNILDLSKQELISLKDELETVKLYLDIESLRFNNAFSFSITIAEEISTDSIRLPPLLIQPFVENAIWHGLLLKEGNKNLAIAVLRDGESLVIEIDDNGIGREASQKFSNKELKRRSFGMDITQDRLSVLDKVFGIFISFHLVDKKDVAGHSLGTTVRINIKL